MTDDGSQPPIEQLATAVHRGPATRSWCGPLLLVLLLIGGVVMLLVFSICCLMSITGVHSNQDHIWLVKIGYYKGFYVDRRS